MGNILYLKRCFTFAPRFLSRYFIDFLKEKYQWNISFNTILIVFPWCSFYGLPDEMLKNCIEKQDSQTRVSQKIRRMLEISWVLNGLVHKCLELRVSNDRKGMTLEWDAASLYRNPQAHVAREHTGHALRLWKPQSLPPMMYSSSSSIPPNLPK